MAVSASNADDADDADDDDDDEGNEYETKLHEWRAQRRAAASVGASNKDDDNDDDEPREAEAAHTRSMATERSSERHPSSDADADAESGNAGANAKAGLVHNGASSPNNDMEMEPRVPVICTRIIEIPKYEALGETAKKHKTKDTQSDDRHMRLKKRLAIQITALKNNRHTNNSSRDMADAKLNAALPNATRALLEADDCDGGCCD